MRETREYKRFKSNLYWEAAFKELFQHMKECNFKEDKVVCPNIRHTVVLDDSRELETRSYDEFLKILVRHNQPKRIRVHSHWNTGKSGDLGCIVFIGYDLSVIVESDDINLLSGIHDHVRELFGGSNQPTEKPTVLPNPRATEASSVQMETNRVPPSVQLRKSIFLAHRFDAQGKAVADTLGKFLRRLGYEVLEGEGYEAREIPAKVSDRIAAHDTFICVVTQGDHGWILSETSYAKALNKRIVLLCEDGVEFNRGILGKDYEHISFPPGVVEKAFTDILSALPT